MILLLSSLRRLSKQQINLTLVRLTIHLPFAPLYFSRQEDNLKRFSSSFNKQIFIFSKNSGKITRDC
jgi:hypothetical protein